MLARQLAEYFHTSWVEEYAREYIGELNRPYSEEDILQIAKGQLQREQEKEKHANGLFFADTELIVTKIWSEVKYGHCNRWILDNIILNPYELYLLCDIDLPWEADPQREHPHMRKELFMLYQNELEKRKAPYAIVSGLGDQRLRNAIGAMKDHGLIL